MLLTTFLEGESLSASCLPTRPSPLSDEQLSVLQLVDSLPDGHSSEMEVDRDSQALPNVLDERYGRRNLIL